MTDNLDSIFTRDEQEQYILDLMTLPSTENHKNSLNLLVFLQTLLIEVQENKEKIKIDTHHKQFSSGFRSIIKRREKLLL